MKNLHRLLGTLSFLVCCLLITPVSAQFQGFGGFSDASKTDSAAGTMLAPVPQRSDWSLGAYIRNLDVGVQISDLVAGGSAEKLGLERNDVIVSVGGYQVGYVGNRLYDVTDEIRKRVDQQTGKVVALVLDSRDRELKNVTLDLNAAESAIGGMITLRDNASLPTDTVMEVQIRNLTKPYQEVNGGRSLSRVSGIGPFSYTIRFDPTYIDSRDQYQLMATVSVNGQPTYFASQPIPAPATGRVTNVPMTIDRIGVVLASGSTPTQVGYPPDQNAVRQLFVQFLGREPMQNEMQAWLEFLSKGRSLDEARVSLLASPQFYELALNDPSRFIQRLYQVSGRQATQQDIQRWVARLQQFQGVRSLVAKEFLEQVR
jgi:uncharacterized lipoprotein YbaY